MTTIFSSGFEFAAFNGDFTGKSGTPTLDTSIYNSGAKSGSFTTSTYRVYKSGITGYTTVYQRCYFRLDTLPSSDGNHLRFMDLLDSGWDNIAMVYYEKLYAGKILGIETPGPTYTNYAVDLLADTWYCLEQKYVQHASAGEYRVWLNGTEVITLTGKNTSALTVGIAEWGQNYSNYAVTNYIDDVVVADAYIGPIITGWTHKFNGIANFTKLNGIARTSIAKINGV